MMQPPARTPAMLIPGTMNNSTKNSITAATTNTMIMKMSIVFLFNGLFF